MQKRQLWFPIIGVRGRIWTKKFDKDIAIVTLAVTLTIAGMSIFAPTSQAQTVAPVSTSAAPTSTTPAAEYNDGDGDELAEHWTDPKDIHEQRYQLAGMMILFIAAGVIAGRRKMKIRRLVRG